MGGSEVVGRRKSQRQRPPSAQNRERPSSQLVSGRSEALGLIAWGGLHIIPPKHFSFNNCIKLAVVFLDRQLVASDQPLSSSLESG